jgi:excisionase family DNA binding protein
MPGDTACEREALADVMGLGHDAEGWQDALVACLGRLADVVEQSFGARERDPDVLLTAEELGDLLHLSPRTLKDQAAAGVLPHHRFGKHYRFHRKDITEILRRSQQTPPPSNGGLRAA